MTTRDLFRWNLGPGGAFELLRFVAACAALTVLDWACERLERVVDGWESALDEIEGKTRGDW